MGYGYNRRNWSRQARTPRVTVKVDPARFTTLLAKGLTTRDKDFVKSLQGGYAKYGSLTENQERVLCKVETRYDASVIASRNAFAAQFASTPAMQEQWALVLNYYTNGQGKGYWSNVVNAAMVHASQGHTYVPTQNVYDKMVGGKYGQKILTEAASPRKYGVGSFVRPTAQSMRTDRWPAEFVGFGLVIGLDDQILAAAKGSKRYTVLWSGCNITGFAEERHLCKFVAT